MPKIDPALVPTGQGTRYPDVYAGPCRGRRWLRLGDGAGLTQFGVNLLTLDPGVWSSQRHWHEKEDEFLYVVSGEVVLVTDAGETVLKSGECAGFKAGSRDGHCLQNRSGAPAQILIVGSRDDTDWGEYSDIDMRFEAGRYSGPARFTRKDGTPF